MTSKSATMTSGLIEALLRLSGVSKEWLCVTPPELLQQCSKILLSRNLVTTDVGFHGNVLKLASNVIEGTGKDPKKRGKVGQQELKGMYCIYSHRHTIVVTQASNALSELSEVSQEILTHCFVTLNIIQHLVESSTPINQAPKSQVNQNSITNPNASPIKQIKASAIVQELAEVASRSESRKSSNEADAKTPVSSNSQV